MADPKAPVEDPMRISKFAEIQSEIERKKDADKAFKSREEYAGFRVPKGTDDQQTAFKQSLDAQRIAARTEPVESLVKRYGIENDPYLAGLYKSYLSAPSSDLKEAYGKMIRQNVDPTVTDLIIGDGQGGMERRMLQAVAETEPMKTYVDAVKGKAGQIKRLTE